VSKAKASKGAGNSFGSKAAFIRSMPSDTPAKVVVEAAAEKGMKLSANHVYAVRSGSNPGNKKKSKGKPGPKPKAARAASARRKPGRPAGSGRGGGGGAGSLETALRNAIADLGLIRAREVFDAVESTFAGRG